MKKFIITLLCLAIIAGGSYFGYEKFQQNKDEKRIVDVVPVSLINQEYYNEEKTTEACVTSGSIQNVELSTQKLVKKVCVGLGDKVKKGDTLLIYDMTVVDLENEKNKNMLAVIDQEIKEQEKEVKRLQGLQPSENAPKNGTSSDKDKEPVKTTTTPKTTTTTTSKKKLTSTTTTTAMIRRVDPTVTTTTTRATRKTTTKKPEPQPVSVRSELTTIENPDGYELDGSILFRCTASTVATADFMQQIIDNGQHVILYVYNDEHRRILYMWDIDPASNPKLEATEWRMSDGVIQNHGSYAYNGPSDLKCGVFYVYIEPDLPDSGEDDYDDGFDYEGDEGGDFDLPDQGGEPEDDGDIGQLPDVTQTPPADTQPEEVEPVDSDDLNGDDDKHIDVDLTDDSDDISDVVDTDSLPDGDDEIEDEKPEDENYKYSRAELVERVKEAQLALKEKQLEYRKAELTYNAGLKQKEDGKVVAQIDGVITRLDDETTSYGGEMVDDAGFNEFYEDEFFEGEDLEDMGGIDEGGMDGGFGDHPYITVQGKATVSLDINVPELSLSKFTKGTVVSGINYNTGEEFSAVVTGRKDDPVSYRSLGDDNPNSSTYIVTADVQDCPTLAINQYVVIKIPEKKNSKKSPNALNLPVSYLRKEGASYYVMMADENGLLKKRYVKTGKIYYNEIIEVLRGLTVDDMVCFPYGKDVKEGVKTRETSDIVW